MAYRQHNDYCAQANWEMGACDLLGSPKQIAWAEAFRWKTLGAFGAIMLRCGYPDPLDLALKSTIAWLLLEKQRAAWWINFIESSGLKNAYQEDLVLHFLAASPYRRKKA